MLNRLFVIAGFLVILAIGGAFVVPRFIQWGDYRERLETMGAGAFGAPVSIMGDISLTLLPQPQLVMSQVRVGPQDAALIEVGRIEAEFSLFDFLSDRYKVTRLELDQPVVSVAVAADGTISSGFALAPEAGESNVSIANADVVDGRFVLTDARSGETHVADSFNGQLRLEALKGPFSFQGTASFAAADYSLRVSSGRVDEAGVASLSFAVGGTDRGFTLEGNGSLQTGARPKYTGKLSYRHAPPRPVEGEAVDIGRGDLVLEGDVEAVPERVLLSNYTLLPDENRAATRMTGAAELALGRKVEFNAIVSGGVVALPPRDATAELTDPPYELVRLLGETPLPFIPEIPGTIGLDITELNLRGLSLRDLRLDATSDGRSWTIDRFAAALPGETRMGLTGNLSIVDGHPIFAGGVSLASRQLDRLASLWRKPPMGNPLVGQEGALTADVALSSDTLTLSAGTLIVAGINQKFDAAIGFGQQRALSLKVGLTTLGDTESEMLAALLPDLTGSGSFGATFPKGAVELSASRATLFGLQGSDLAASAQWEGGVLELSRLHAGDLGGASIDARLTAFGTLAKPELSGNGTIKINDGAPIVTSLLERIATPAGVTEFVGRSLPATLSFQLDPPKGEGSQMVEATGRLGTADTTIVAMLGEGIAKALTGPIEARIEMQSGSPSLMTAQLGLGSTPLFDDRTPLQLQASFDGTPSNSYEVHARLTGGEDHLAFDGNVIPGNFQQISGTGVIDAALGDPAALMEIAGAGGVYLPPLSGTARVQFTGLDRVRLSEIDAEGTSGEIELVRRDNVAAFTGALAVEKLDGAALIPILTGASGTVAGDGVWPAGPIDIGAEPRKSNGRISIDAAQIDAGGEPLLSNARFGLAWDAQSLSVRELTGTVEGGGTLTFDATICCANPNLPAKQLTGRVALADIALDQIAPDAVGAGLDGRITASAAFDGTGATLAETIGAMTGTGSYTISDFSVAQLDPQAFNNLASIAGVVDLTPEALAEMVRERLAAGPFESAMFTGSFTIAGGTLRSPNLAIAGSGARMFGGGNLRLTDFNVDARYAMSPTLIADPSLVDATTAEIAAVVSGPIWAPVASYDVAALVDAIKIRASEIELARLEQLRIEDEARRQEAAADRARVAAEQAAAEAARKAAEEAARVAKEEADRKAADEAKARAAAEAARQAPPPPLDLGL